MAAKATKATKATKAATESTESTIIIPPVQRKLMRIRVKGLPESPYIPHRLDPKRVRDNTKNIAGSSSKKKLRDLDAEYESCFYYNMQGKYAQPPGAYMQAMLDTSMTCNVAKTEIKRSIRVLGDGGSIDIISHANIQHPATMADNKPLKKGEPAIHRVEDVGRQSGITRAPMLIHRPYFWNWEADLLLLVSVNLIDPVQVINLVNNAGFTSGVGDWRPSSPKSPGTCGMFEVVGYELEK